jgi:electron transport complex protein RnfG
LILVGALSVVSGVTVDAAGQIFIKPKEALEKWMPESDTLVQDPKVLTPELRDRLQEIIGKRVRDKGYTFIISMKNNEPAGYAVMLNMTGKERPITFMVVVDPNGTVRGVEVLIYRESQGSEIRYPGFMGQFEGKTVRSPLKLGRDIDAVTGATLSSRSATYVVKKALALMEIFYGIQGSDGR